MRRHQEGVSLVFRDILVGEVWFCSGQSNMEYHVHCPSNRFYGLPEGAELVASAHDDGLPVFPFSAPVSA